MKVDKEIKKAEIENEIESSYCYLGFILFMHMYSTTSFFLVRGKKNFTI